MQHTVTDLHEETDRLAETYIKLRPYLKVCPIKPIIDRPKPLLSIDDTYCIIWSVGPWGKPPTFEQFVQAKKRRREAPLARPGLGPFVKGVRAAHGTNGTLRPKPTTAPKTNWQKMVENMEKDNILQYIPFTHEMFEGKGDPDDDN